MPKKHMFRNKTWKRNPSHGPNCARVALSLQCPSWECGVKVPLDGFAWGGWCMSRALQGTEGWRGAAHKLRKQAQQQDERAALRVPVEICCIIHKIQCPLPFHGLLLVRIVSDGVKEKSCWPACSLASLLISQAGSSPHIHFIILSVTVKQKTQ